MLRGALAAAVTPLRDGGAALDEDAFGPVVEFLQRGGVDGLLAFGTNGEGILLSVAERKRGLRLFIDAAAGRLQIAAHCGAQTTVDTVALAADAVEAGADAVAVIAPPYFVLDENAQLAHFGAAAHACAPTPFYVYEFAKTSGYPVAIDVLARLQDAVPNFAGLKVSDAPWEAFEPYLLPHLLPRLDVFVGPESLIYRGLRAGAIGAVSALASAFPAEVAAAVREPTEAAAARLGELRAIVDTFPRQAALKRIIAGKGVQLESTVRAPLRDLTLAEATRLDAWLETV